jgi:hypothetical protein
MPNLYLFSLVCSDRLKPHLLLLPFCLESDALQEVQGLGVWQQCK